MAKKIVIVGGVGGGATAAAQIRRQDKEAEIILVDKGNHIAFSNCGMPYYIGEVIRNKESLLVSTDKFAEKYDVDVRTNSEVLSINRSGKKLQYKTNTATQTETYDKLILAPGASAITPDIEGLNNENTFTLRTIPDMERIYAYIQDHKPASVAIIGAGFVGLEMVENLHAIGLDCTIIDRSEQVSKLIDKDMAGIIEEHIQEKGVRVLLNEGLGAFSNNGKTLHLSSEKSVETDMTILAVGIKPNSKLAADANLNLGNKNAINVNEYMQTNDPDIYALGDAVETSDFLTGKPRYAALAGPAHRQAFIIARHIAGAAIPYEGSTGAAILKVFDLTVAASGHNQASLKQLGYPFKEVTLDTYSHVGYYPSSEKLSIKVLFNDTNGTIYGAQVVGLEGVDKRHAVLATAIKGKLTVADLPDLELAYAPPYSSPKDPINIVGYKAVAVMEEAD